MARRASLGEGLTLSLVSYQDHARAPSSQDVATACQQAGVALFGDYVLQASLSVRGGCLVGTPLHRHRWVHLVVGLAVSVGCLVWATWDLIQDDDALSRVGDAFSRANYRSLAPMWVVLTLFYLLKAWRWRLLLRPVGDYDLWRELLPPTMIGFAFNNLLPAHLGDFVRVYVFARKAQVSATAVLSTVVLERVFDIAAILLLMGVGLVFVPGLDPTVHRAAWTFAGGAAGVVIAAVVYMIWTKPFVRVVESAISRLPFLPNRFRSKITTMLEAGASGLSALKSPLLLGGIFTSSLGQWLLNGVLIYLSLWSFGVVVSPLVACIVLGVVALGVAVPSSPGYFGVIQFCFMAVLKLFGTDEADVFAASVYYHLSQYIPVTLVGLYYFNTTGLSFSEVEAAAEGSELPADGTLSATVGSTPPKSLASISTAATSVTRTE